MSDGYFGNTGKLGFGNMRLPRIDGNLDYNTIYSMIDAYIGAGYSYFDTCYVYEASEKALGETLVPRYPRDSYQLNTKLSLLKIKNAEEMQTRFEISLERLGLEYVDFYFLHSLTVDYLKKADELDAWGFLRKLKDKGLAKHIGFSFHETPEILDDTLSKHPETELVLLQLNYLDWDNPKHRSRELYETARRHNVPISVMEPCKGGWLASEVSELGKFLKAANPDVSVASWAFRFLAELEGIHSILSGMGALSEVEDNIKTFKEAKPLTSEERKLLKKAVEIINASPSIPCTGCRYCVPVCPKEIDIPETLQHYNNHLIYSDLASLKHLFYMQGLTAAVPSDCVKCGACEKVCPQHIGISDLMTAITEATV